MLLVVETTLVLEILDASFAEDEMGSRPAVEVHGPCAFFLSDIGLWPVLPDLRWPYHPQQDPTG
jgi:hypothetical protein